MAAEDNDHLDVGFPFRVKEGRIEPDITYSYFDIETLDSDTVLYLDSVIVPIYGGVACADSVELTKRRFKKLFSTKTSDTNWVMGATAEFFSHIYLNHYGYKQEFMFHNLEEGSIKKGFDGLYSHENNIWLMESKSGLESPVVSHPAKVKEAVRDLSNKIAGRTTNDPWNNAYSHANMIDVNASASVRSQIKKLSDDYVQGHFLSLSDVSIVPCATVYYSVGLKDVDIDAIIVDLKDYFGERKHGPIHVVCVSNAALAAFLSYIGVKT